jgi:hypothetical protein
VTKLENISTCNNKRCNIEETTNPNNLGEYGF